MTFKDEHIHQNLEVLLYIFMVLIDERIHYKLVVTLCIFRVFNKEYVHHDLNFESNVINVHSIE